MKIIFIIFVAFALIDYAIIAGKGTTDGGGNDSTEIYHFK